MQGILSFSFFGSSGKKTLLDKADKIKNTLVFIYGVVTGKGNDKCLLYVYSTLHMLILGHWIKML